MQKKFIGLCFFASFFWLNTYAEFIIPPAPQNYIVDQAQVLSAKEKQALTTQIEALKTKTSAEVGVLITPTVGDEDISALGTKIAQQWGIGNKKSDNGVFIVIAVEDRQWRIDIGYGLEGVIPDIISKRVAEKNFPPNFRAQNYFLGVSGAIEDFEKIITKSPDSIINTPSVSKTIIKKQTALDILIKLVLIALFGTIIFFRKKKNKKSFLLLYFLVQLGVAFFATVQLVLIIGFLLAFPNIALFLNSSGGGGSFGRSGGFGGGGFGGGSFGGGGSSGRW